MIPADQNTYRPLVLIADDDVTMRLLACEALEQTGFQVMEAQDGEEALEAFHHYQPQVVLLDVMMPKMSGFEVCRRIKNNPLTSDLPVIMVTALNEMGDIERAIESGTDDFLSKPVNKLELLTRVKTMLKLKHLSDQLERTLAYLSELEKEHK